MKFVRSILISAAIAGFAIGQTARAHVEIGQAAPDFTLTDLDGHARKLSDYKGKIVVLEWNNPDCPIVHKHYDSGNIPKLQKSATAQGVVWLLINSGAPGLQGGDYSSAEIKAWLKQRGSVPTSYLRDPDGKVGHLYAAKATPHLFVIKPDGVLAYEGAIDSVPSANQRDIPRAENYVSEALAAVEAGQPVTKTSTRPYGCAIKYGDESILPGRRSRWAGWSALGTTRTTDVSGYDRSLTASNGDGKKVRVHRPVGHFVDGAGHPDTEAIPNLDSDLSSGHVHGHGAIDQAQAMGDRGRGARTRTRGQGIAGPAFPNLDPDVLPVDHLQELNVGPAGKIRMHLEIGPVGSSQFR